MHVALHCLQFEEKHYGQHFRQSRRLPAIRRAAGY